MHCLSSSWARLDLGDVLPREEDAAAHLLRAADPVLGVELALL